MLTVKHSGKVMASAFVVVLFKFCRDKHDRLPEKEKKTIIEQ